MAAKNHEGGSTGVDRDELDRCLSPLRRSLSAALRGEARYVGAIGLRWARQVDDLLVDRPERAQVADLIDALEGVDDLEGDDKALRVQHALDAIAALDQAFGLATSDLDPVPEDAPDPELEIDDLDALLVDDDEPAVAEPLLVEAASEPAFDELVLDDLDALLEADPDPSPVSVVDVDDDLDLDALLLVTDGEASAPPPKRGRGQKRGRKTRNKRSERESRKKVKKKREEPPKRVVPSVRYGDPTMAAAPVSSLELGPDEAAALQAAGISDVDGLLQRRPRGESVVQPVVGAGRLDAVGRVAVGGRVRARYSRISPDGTVVTTLVIKGAGLTTARVHGGAPGWMLEALPLGERCVLVGEAVQVDDAFELHDPELATDDGKHAARLPTYGIDAVPDSAARSLIRQVLPALPGIQEPLPSSLRQARSLVDLGTALADVHTQGSRAARGRARLGYDEALLTQLGLLWPSQSAGRVRGMSHSLLHALGARVLQHVQAELTDEQQVAFEEIKRDLRSSTPMRRVLTGEVGAGKGLVVLLSTALVAENKHQVMILAPDQATAEQRFLFTEPLLRELGLVSRLYTEPPSKAQRDAIKRGEVHVLFGTKELLEADIECRRLGLVIAGERDVFGRIKELVPTHKGAAPDLLVVTSTPVPVPVLLSAYPTFDHTVLKHLPGQPVPCQVVQAEARSTAYGAAAEAVARGEQAVVVFPMSRGADVLDVREALNVVSTLETRVFPGKRVKLFHGAMSREERFRTYDDFSIRRIDVLVATTHFEAGPAIPGVSVVIIEQADRMPLSRMHRVRGHLSVSGHDPRCWLITGETPDEDGLARVERFASSQDGFAVSAQELAHRGLEDMVVDATVRLPELEWVDPIQDIDVLLQARRDARKLLAADSGLRSPSNLELARYLRARWPALFGSECPVPVSASGGGRRRRRRRRR